MDIVTETAVHLAEHVAPEEIDLAPALAHAAAAGGAEWDVAKVGAGGPVLGGIGLEVVGGIFIAVLVAIQNHADLLANLCTLGDTLVRVVRYLHRRLDRSTDGTDDIDNAAKERADAAVAALVEELLKRGIEADRAEKIGCLTIIVLAERPAQGRVFVDAVQPKRSDDRG
jgi:hypothetical protein